MISAGLQAMPFTRPKPEDVLQAEAVAKTFDSWTAPRRCGPVLRRACAIKCDRRHGGEYSSCGDRGRVTKSIELVLVPDTRRKANARLSRHFVSRPRIRQPGVATGRPDQRRPTRSHCSLAPQLESGVGGDRRRWPSVDGADDFAAVDALEVDAGDPEVGVPELALDHDERNALVRHFDCVSVS
jgi:hypothetical protein